MCPGRGMNCQVASFIYDLDASLAFHANSSAQGAPVCCVVVRLTHPLLLPLQAANSERNLSRDKSPQL
eukprot:6532816-Pyramimonas_sp.AAC.1